MRPAGLTTFRSAGGAASAVARSVGTETQQPVYPEARMTRAVRAELLETYLPILSSGAAEEAPDRRLAVDCSF